MGDVISGPFSQGRSTAGMLMKKRIFCWVEAAVLIEV